MSFFRELLATPSHVPTTSNYTAMNDALYLAAGALLVAWPGATQVLFRDRAFVGDGQGFIRAMGLLVIVISWLYLFGGRAGAQQIVAASVVDRLVFVPVVLMPLAASGVFPHLLVTFAILDPALALGACALLARRPISP
ncbi:hypothetical protein [Methylobacterium sp. NEAU K]|uniref:hypothetical protein n=1 Tax=Methylobacterium sp. NEAU K TaxID=3064946 RepID=UPI0027342BE6|nr:hypothetical protein [Methylobacterium sp. NEAU K]MDP4006805.1 hypothetical protein [Methylobacterium sp. NEAU K]